MSAKSVAKKVILTILGVLVLGAGGLRVAGRLPIPGYDFPVNVQFRAPAEPLTPSQLESRIRVPAGFAIDYFVEDLPRARFMRFTSSGDLLVSTPRADGAIHLVLRDRDGDGRADGVRTLLQGLNAPHGMDFKEDWLYIAETDKIVRVRFDAQQGQLIGEPEVVVPNLPSGGNHFTRTLRFGPDGLMYVSVGSSCNVCEEQDERRAAMLRFAADGSGYELYATGLRNTVGFDFRPGTGDLFGTDNGRDLLGDDFPPCEFNRIERGGFYGFPYAHGSRVPDPEFGKLRPERVAQSIPPAFEFGAHTAPLGMTFYRGDAFPEALRGAAFVAQHGSWNRSEKAGYRVLALTFDASGEISASDFATGFELDEDVVGRPADVIEGPDGALYISDDFAGAVYRVWYQGEDS